MEEAYTKLAEEIEQNLKPLLKNPKKTIPELVNEAGKNTSFNKAVSDLHNNKEPNISKGSAANLLKDAVSFAISCTKNKFFVEELQNNKNHEHERGL